VFGVRKDLVFKALLMIVLVVSLPFVSAVHMYDVEALGGSGVDGVVTEDDSVAFNIFIDLDGQEASGVGPADVASQGLVIVKGSAEHVVDDCSWHDESQGQVVCSKSLTLETSTGDVFSYDVLFNNNPYSPKPFLYLDTVGPDYADMELTAHQEGMSVVYTLNAKDRANAGGSGVCSGLDSYSLFIRTETESETESGFTENNVGSGTFNGECEDSSSDSFDVPASSVGSVMLCGEVKDKFGNTNTICKSIEVDGIAPVISVPVVHTQADDLYNGAIIPGGEFLKLKFDVVENIGIDLTKSFLNVTAGVDEDVTEQYSLAEYDTVTRAEDGNTYHVESNNFLVSGVYNVDYLLRIYDTNGNYNEITQFIDAEEDFVGPVFTSISGKVESDGVIYVGVEDDFNVTFQENGAGMDDGDVYLNMGRALKKATRCEFEESLWRCYFEDMNFGAYVEGPHYMAVDASSADDAGNYVEEIVEVKFVLDKTAPVLHLDERNITGTSSLGEINVISAGNTVRLNFTYEDDSPVTGVVNFSALGKPGQDEIDIEYNMATLRCEDGVCIGESDRVGAGGLSRNVEVVLTDIVGNVGRDSFDLKVLNVNGTADVWDGAVQKSPPNFDREVSEIMNQRAFVEITFVTDEPNMTIVSVDFDECVSPENLTNMQGGREYIVSADYVGASDDKTQHYIAVETKATEYYIDEILMDCQFQISSYSADTLYPSNDEVVSVTFGLFNNPADLPDEALIGKIMEAYDEAGGMWATLDALYKWVYWLKKLCSIFNIIRGVITSIANILGILGITEMALKSNPFTFAAGEGVWASEVVGCEAMQLTNQVTDNGIIKTVGKFCSWVACDLPVEEWSGDWFGSIQDSGFGSVANAYENAGGWGGNKDTGQGVMEANGFSIWSSDSLITQIMRLCLPGILKKAHEWRSIKCQYVICLVEQMGNGEATEAMCESIKNNMECRYIFGEIWSMIPFVGFVESLMDMVKMIMTDYFTGLMLIADWSCTAICKSPNAPATLTNICGYVFKVTKFIDSVGQLVKVFKNFKQMFNFENNDKACDDMEDIKKAAMKEGKGLLEKLRTRTSHIEDTEREPGSVSSDDAISSDLGGYGGTAASSGGVDEPVVADSGSTGGVDGTSGDVGVADATGYGGTSADEGGATT